MGNHLSEIRSEPALNRSFFRCHVILRSRANQISEFRVLLDISRHKLAFGNTVGLTIFRLLAPGATAYESLRVLLFNNFGPFESGRCSRLCDLNNKVKI